MGTGVPLGVAPFACTATVALPIRTGAEANVLSKRSRTRGPPADVCTTSRSVRSVHGPTVAYVEVGAAQLPVQPAVSGRTESANTCRSTAYGNRTEATSCPRVIGAVATNSLAFSVS
ncbi:hypothetical protein QFZ49_007070 [Streptomyces turgidiscabies]|uniref:Secreted protein n=1 Tax=Streptomyces turgidiscabies TaxID=85558 RepID=A0ABU0S1R8_9ACTN|nr:hypothetical protein [Streptomyces turgidiscabies]